MHGSRRAPASARHRTKKRPARGWAESLTTSPRGPQTKIRGNCKSGFEHRLDVSGVASSRPAASRSTEPGRSVIGFSHSTAEQPRMASIADVHHATDRGRHPPTRAGRRYATATAADARKRQSTELRARFPYLNNTVYSYSITWVPARRSGAFQQGGGEADAQCGKTGLRGPCSRLGRSLMIAMLLADDRES